METSKNNNEKNHTDSVASPDNANDNYPANTTTVSGYDEAEREILDSTNTQNPAEPSTDNGSQELVEKYNINDKAYSDSSKEDFVKTVSNFHHADEKDDVPDQE